MSREDPIEISETFEQKQQVECDIDIDYLKSMLKIRTVTCFLTLSFSDFDRKSANIADGLESKLNAAVSVGRWVERALIDAGYTVQTVRLATNPFLEWLLPEYVAEGVITGDNGIFTRDEEPFKDLNNRLARLNKLLQVSDINFCALGSVCSELELQLCPRILAASQRFSCCAVFQPATNVAMAKAAAMCIRNISRSDDCSGHGLGNFRFCVAYANRPIPFFPVATTFPVDNLRHNNNRKRVFGDNAATIQQIQFAIGLENGCLAQVLLGRCDSLDCVSQTFSNDLAQTYKPIQDICQQAVENLRKESPQNFIIEYLGMDTSLVPSLEKSGSVAAALELLPECVCFGGPGTLAVAASVTKCLQSLPGIITTGYCGLMLPVCEDARLVELADEGKLRIADLLSISQVCGVGLDTIPIPGDCSIEQLSSVLLDVVGIGQRWDKNLSCRVFPVLGKKAGEYTDFDSPYLINSKILPLS